MTARELWLTSNQQVGLYQEQAAGHVNRCHAGNTCVAGTRCKPGTLYWGHTCCKVPFRSINLFMGLTNLKKKNGFPRNWINPPGSSVERPRGRSSGADVCAVLGVQANPPAQYSIAWFSKSVWQTKFTKGQEHCCAVAQCEAPQVVLNIAVLMPTLCAPQCRSGGNVDMDVDVSDVSLISQAPH